MSTLDTQGKSGVEDWDERRRRPFSFNHCHFLERASLGLLVDGPQEKRRTASSLFLHERILKV